MTLDNNRNDDMIRTKNAAMNAMRSLREKERKRLMIARNKVVGSLALDAEYASGIGRRALFILPQLLAYSANSDKSRRTRTVKLII